MDGKEENGGGENQQQSGNPQWESFYQQLPVSSSRSRVEMTPNRVLPNTYMQPPPPQQLMNGYARRTRYYEDDDEDEETYVRRRRGRKKKKKMKKKRRRDDYDEEEEEEEERHSSSILAVPCCCWTILATVVGTLIVVYSLYALVNDMPPFGKIHETHDDDLFIIRRTDSNDNSGDSEKEGDISNALPQDQSKPKSRGSHLDFTFIVGQLPDVRNVTREELISGASGAVFFIELFDMLDHYKNSIPSNKNPPRCLAHHSTKREAENMNVPKLNLMSIWPSQNGTTIHALNTYLVGWREPIEITVDVKSSRYPKAQAKTLTLYETIWIRYIDADFKYLFEEKQEDSRRIYLQLSGESAVCVQIALLEFEGEDMFI
ncbi:MAG: hypothetical protein ACTSUE_13865 [Promethearchaeota archaeon]